MIFFTADHFHIESPQKVTGVGCNSVEGTLDSRELVLPPNLLQGEESRCMESRIV